MRREGGLEEENKKEGEWLDERLEKEEGRKAEQPKEDGQQGEKEREEEGLEEEGQQGREEREEERLEEESQSVEVFTWPPGAVETAEPQLEEMVVPVQDTDALDQHSVIVSPSLPVSPTQLHPPASPSHDNI